LEIYNSEEHPLSPSESDPRIDIFRQFIDSPLRCHFEADFVAGNGDRYVCATFNIGFRKHIKFCLKRTEEIEAIISSKTGGEVTNAIQRLGSVETYQRRYLYMIALDIVESDSIEPLTGNNPPPAPKPTAPATPEKRQEVTKNLTAPEGNATELQIKGLKAALAKLLEVYPGKEDFVSQIAMQTNGLTEISKADCEALINAVTNMLEVK
jgi:hypothetical protein